MNPQQLSQEIWRRLKLTAQVFRERPFDGKALQTFVQGDTDAIKGVGGLSPPVRCQEEASITVSQYVSYANGDLPTFWSNALPSVIADYGDSIRYEHHDVPVLSSQTMAYQLSTIGRAIQDEYGNIAFWNWFDLLMNQGVTNIEQAYELASYVNIDTQEPSHIESPSTVQWTVDTSLLQRAVENDYYRNVIKQDISLLASHGVDVATEMLSNAGTLGNMPERGIFIVFVNDNPVPPSYEGIQSGIESYRYG